MAVGTLGSWQGRTIIIARTLLATTLLLSAFVGASHPTVNAEIVFLCELFLGAAIAAGWRIRYVAVLVFLGTIAARLLGPDLRLVLLPTSVGTTAALLIASGILICFGRSTDTVNIAPIDEHNDSPSEHLRGTSYGPRQENLEVTIRLEDGHLPRRWKSRCIVTVHDRAGGVLNTDQESWYARNEHSH